ncbi:MAG: osmotically-inducible protein OsmY [Pirellulaceae bacterium]|jgi:osmotically-inducible protein OsmY
MKTLHPIQFLIALSLCAAPSAIAQEINPFADALVRVAVEAKLEQAEGLVANDIETTVVNGVVTLSGSVDNLIAWERATEAAMSRRGVRSVVNRIVVEPERRPDEEIRQDVIEALATDPVGAAAELEVAVGEGAVTISGPVSSITEQALLTRVAASVRGVREVKNRLTLPLEAERDNETIQRNILSRFKFDVWLSAIPIEVRVEDGVVQLSGKVASLGLRNRAANRAVVDGVREVNADDLEVDPTLKSFIGARNPSGRPNDKEIAGAIVDGWFADPRVVSQNPNADVDIGVVTLTGSVNSLASKRAAEQVARDTVGVRQVDSYLKVRPDEALEGELLIERVERALARNPAIRSLGLGVSSTGRGRIRLFGTAAGAYERATAETTAELVAGVTDVTNFLKIEGIPVSTKLPPVIFPIKDRDEYIRRSIREEFAWNSGLDASDIEVSVLDSVATLTGSVAARYESQVATALAIEAGALTVRNELEITQEPLPDITTTIK